MKFNIGLKVFIWILIIAEVVLLTLYWEGYADVLVAIGTLALAGMTLYSTRQSNKREQERIIESQNVEIRDRKERYIDEIIIWLRGLEAILFSNVSGDMVNKLDRDLRLIKDRDISTDTLNEYTLLDDKLDNMNVLGVETVQSEYCIKLASILSVELENTLSGLSGYLKERKQQYSEKEITIGSIETDLTSFDLNTNAGNIRDTIIKSFEIATKFKTELLNL